MEEPEIIFRKIARNKGAALPYNERLKNHQLLIDSLHKAIENQRKHLENVAFAGVFIDTLTDINDPFEAVRLAIHDHDYEGIRIAAAAGYKTGRWNAVRLAGEFDRDIENLVEHLKTYGPLANLTQRLFLRFALIAPAEPSV